MSRMNTRRAFCAVNGAGETAAGALSASFALCVCCALAAFSLSAGEDVLRFVDPFVGTDGTGHAFPGACVPFGLAQASPDLMKCFTRAKPLSSTPRPAPSGCAHAPVSRRSQGA